MTIERYNIDKINVSRVNMGKALQEITLSLNSGKVGYICVTNTRTSYIANQDPSYCQIQNNSMLTVPDGIPLVWIAHFRGVRDVERVSGPDLLNQLLSVSEENQFSHFFYGSTPRTINLIEKKVKQNYPTLEFKGFISPPFQPIEKFDIEELASELNHLKPTFFWCGLGAPKQEQLISLLQPKLEATICIGVGLAFDYIAENVKRAPKWMQQTGLEGAYNNIRNPYRAKRFVKPFFWILLKLIESRFGSYSEKEINKAG